ncbi:nuclear transport factor 2 family protein [Streptomyces botrytidirepellens]|uniref:Nuclear transport factor 2 family protein n=1 Tax=Streptomyces botrytidirepellens TaxID=2486417 RepID=A0A3M8WQ41_9ACTN|nr:nuclear transport factor 2 family protein [Streptomyces botrytidirepellens]RNG31594.1 nuclear transport factor 2 family protein [Streptomyces botrytidirepellens]
MKPLAQGTPEQFIADFFTTFHEQVVRGDHDPAPAMSRFYTPDIVMINDGIRLDWAKLLSHIHPVRKNLAENDDSRFEVHEAIADGNRIAARLTIHAATRKKRIATDVVAFYTFTPDGRMTHAHGITRPAPKPKEQP